MRVWLDTEFIDTGWVLDANSHLISIGLVREDGKTFYAENAAVNYHALSPWLKANVVPKLGELNERLFLPGILDGIMEFCADIKPHFWAFYASYDFLLLCKIFGGLMALPKGWTRYCGDVRQYLMYVEDAQRPDAPRQLESTKHHALQDALWLKELHLWYEQHYTLTSRMVQHDQKAESSDE